jgi:hypothetical protein
VRDDVDGGSDCGAVVCCESGLIGFVGVVFLGSASGYVLDGIFVKYELAFGLYLEARACLFATLS